jgi:Ca2+-binding EF-hand superfamily protein
MSLSGVGATDTASLMNPLGTVTNPSASRDFAADFESIDPNATGVITQTEFEQAFASLNWPDSLKAQGADAIFAQLDPEGTGRVQYADFVSGMTALAPAVAPSTTDTSASDPSATDAAASSSGLSGISSLFASLSSTSATDQTTSDPTDDIGTSDPAAQAALTQTFETAYNSIDTSGAGYITAPQLAQAFGSLTLPANIAALGSGGILAKLDPNYTGQISHSDFVAGLTDLASAPSAPDAPQPVDDSTSSADSASSTDGAALSQLYGTLFDSITADDGSDALTEMDIEDNYDQLQLPASLRASKPSDIFARLDPYSTGQVTRANFIRDMTALVAAAQNQEAQAAAAAAAAQPAGSRDFAAMFTSIDVDGTGSVTLRQFEQAYESLPLDPSIAGLGADEIFSMLDPDATGSVSAATFVSGMNSLASAEDYFRAAAPGVDSDGDGSITPDEFQQAFDSLELPATVKDLGAPAAYSQIDPFYTRQVSIADFVTGMTALVAQSVTPAAAAATSPDSSSA